MNKKLFFRPIKINPTLTIVQVRNSVLEIDDGRCLVDAPFLLSGIIADLDEDNAVLVQVVVNGLKKSHYLLTLGRIAVV